MKTTPESSPEEYFREWRVGSTIGSGGYAKVYRAFHRKDESIQKALKFVRFESDADYEEFMHEARITKEVSGHANVLAIENLIRDHKNGWMVFELMDGDAYDMFTRRWKSTNMSFKEPLVATATRQLLHGVLYCHQNGVVHFDIKPQNLLYKVTKRADDELISWKLCDFNLARHLRSHTLGFYSQVYTLGYRAPEVILAELSKGNTRYCERAEMYGVGSSVFQMLTEFCAFENYLSGNSNDTDSRFVQCVLQENLLGCLDHYPNLSPQARDFIIQMMMFDPKQRMTLGDAQNHPFVTRKKQTEEEERSMLHKTQVTYLKEYHTRKLSIPKRTTGTSVSLSK